ncbi:MAG: hypothetical protein ACLUYZ_02945 [Lachnospiraceae bacterium]
MKKIIATVLAMVMALALCTTAFAASKYVLYDEDKKSTDIMVTKTDASSKNKTTLYYTYVDENDATHYLVPAERATMTAMSRVTMLRKSTLMRIPLITSSLMQMVSWSR